jgi:hypothetical protein
MLVNSTRIGRGFDDGKSLRGLYASGMGCSIAYFPVFFAIWYLVEGLDGFYFDLFFILVVEQSQLSE